MKFKTTRKAITEGCKNIKCASYCELAHLLINHEPIAYTSGVYGWNFDVYEVYGLTICTGYRGMPGKRLEGAHDFEEQARDILNDRNMDWKHGRDLVENLLKGFCVLNGGEVYNYA